MVVVLVEMRVQVTTPMAAVPAALNWVYLEVRIQLF